MKLLKILLALNLLCLPAYSEHKVYLIHGYGGNGIELMKITNALQSKGYTQEKFHYKSLKIDIDSAAKILFQRLVTETADTVSFVTHSMGGIVVRSLFQNIAETPPIPMLYRIVMLAPPNSGSPVADFYGQFAWAEKLVGPNIHNLTTDSVTGAAKYPVPACDFGIIIGEENRKQWISVPLPARNDGIVSVESAKMKQAKDLYFIQASHVSMLWKKETIRQVISFIDSGKFIHS